MIKKITIFSIFYSLTFINSVNAGGIDRYKEWFDAAREGKLEVIQKFIGKFDINVQDKFGSTALMWAASLGHENIVKLLLNDRTIGVNAQDVDGQTALIVAARRGHINIVKLLLSHPDIDVNVQNKKDYSALLMAVESGKGNDAIVKILLAVPGINVNAPNFEGFTALISAAFYDYENIVKLLLQNPTINVNMQTKIVYGPSHFHWQGYTALIVAAQKGFESIVKLLIEAHANANIKNAEGKTALMQAVWHENLVKLLLQSPRVEINAQDQFGRTALMVAVMSSNENIVKILLDAGADPNLKNYEGKTALDLANVAFRPTLEKLISESRKKPASLLSGLSIELHALSKVS